MTDPHAIDRDHPRKRFLSENGPGPHLEQYRCDMCGAWFLLRSTFERHKAAEIPAFVEASLAKNAAWERSRERHRAIYPLVLKELCEVPPRGPRPVA